MGLGEGPSRKLRERLGQRSLTRARQKPAETIEIPVTPVGL
jgi:hypothetical protein